MKENRFTVRSGCMVTGVCFHKYSKEQKERLHPGLLQESGREDGRSIEQNGRKTAAKSGVEKSETGLRFLKEEYENDNRYVCKKRNVLWKNERINGKQKGPPVIKNDDLARIVQPIAEQDFEEAGSEARSSTVHPSVLDAAQTKSVSGYRSVVEPNAERIVENDTDRNHMLNQYGIRNNYAAEREIRDSGQNMNRFSREDRTTILQEPQVCSIEERKKIENERCEAAKYTKSGRKNADSLNPGYTEYAKAAMIKDFLIKEGLQEEGNKADVGRLLGRIAKHEGKKALIYIGEKLLQLLWSIAAAILPFLILATCVILIVALILGFLMHPLSFFLVNYDTDEDLKGNPKYLKNTVQEMYVGFHGGISAFADQDEHNQVVYEYGNIPNTDAVLAVYLTELFKRPDYGSLTEDAETLQPYLLVDTDTEEKLLLDVFQEFNYIQMEEIEVQGSEDSPAGSGEPQSVVEVDLPDTGTNVTELGELRADNQGGVVKEEAEDVIQGEEPAEIIKAEKMTVYCLSLMQWKRLHLSFLTEEEQELLKLLEEYGAKTTGEAGDDIPIPDISIPDGADRNLIYMAAFIKAEAGNQSFRGQVAVANVILNRAGGPSGDIIGVLTAPYQFSCYIPFHTVEHYIAEYAAMPEAQRASDSCYLAAAGAYVGEHQNPIEDMKYYCNPKACSGGESVQWAKIRAKNEPDDIIVIGDHVFCRYCW